MKKLIEEIKNQFIKLRSFYNYPPLITHFICIIIGVLICLSFSKKTTSLPSNSIIITLDKKFFIPYTDEKKITQNKLFFISKLDHEHDQICRINIKPVKLIGVTDRIYSFQTHSEDIVSIKNIYTKKHRVKITESSSKIDNLKTCSFNSTKIRYE